MQIKEVIEASSLDDILKKSAETPLLIFKHSCTCSISLRAKREVEAFNSKFNDKQIPIYQVVVQEARALSNEIASRLNITHQSPQVILLSNGQSAWDCSHGAITKEILKYELDKFN